MALFIRRWGTFECPTIGRRTRSREPVRITVTAWKGSLRVPAIEARWGIPGTDLPSGHPAWDLEARYLAFGLANLVCTLSPRRIVMGGGVMQRVDLFALIRRQLRQLLNGYIQSNLLTERIEEYVVPACLGDRSGVLGAVVLAEKAVGEVEA